MPAIRLSNAYTQNFDTLVNAGIWADDGTIVGWYANRTSYSIGTGSNNAGALYSFGSNSASDRALGGVASGSTGTIFWGVRFLNDTNTTVSSLNISFTGEQWRTGGSTTTTPSLAQTLDFQYQVNPPSLTGGTWIDFNNLDFISPTFGTTTASALDGNLGTNRTVLSSTLNGLNLAPGQEIWLRWQDINDANNDHGLAVDDLAVTATFTDVVNSTVTIEAIDAEAAETGSNPGTFRISRTGNLNADLTVNYAVVTGTNQATNGIDYTPNLTGTVVIGANQTFVEITITPVDDTQVEGNETVTLNLLNSINYNLGIANTATITITDNDTPPPIRIRDIQGLGHISPLVGTTVTNVAGVVTAVRSNGFYIQDTNPDNNNATSEGIFVFRGSTGSKANVGDSVLVTGRVDEFRGSPVRDTDLTVTQINATVTGSGFSVLSIANALPAPIIIGVGGLIPPSNIIANDAVGGNVENAGSLFDPAEDGIDFYESLEGMLVQINNAVAIGPTNSFGEIPALVDNGVNAGERTNRGGIRVQPGDFNPERIIIDDLIVTNEPQVNVGDRFNDAIIGVMDYSFSNFKLLNTTALTVTSGGLTKETTTLVGDEDRLTVVSFNVENLSPQDPSSKFANLANRIVNNLRSPDIISLEEIQDNNGPTNDSVVDATQTYQLLINAIIAAGGPSYQFRQINPTDDQDGGQLGGNIRVGFLFNPNRVSFIDRAGGDSTTNTTIINGANGVELSASPGRIVDTDLSDGNAFSSSRKPLVGEFLFNNNKVFVIGNHFNSKGGDQPLFGRFQPPTLTTEVQRLQQAQQVKAFVAQILAIDPTANVVVAGDLNDFEFSQPLAVLESAGLNNLVKTLPVGDRYTYNFEGNAQVLDQILVSNNLSTQAEIDIVHFNSEFFDQDSDHDPLVARFYLPILINGTANPDNLVGTSRNEVINGLGGDDFISGASGNDIINGGIGNGDRLFAGDGNDIITDPDGIFGAHGGTGNDTITITFAPSWDNNTNPNDAPRSDGKITGGYGDDIITVTMNNPRFFINLKGDEPVSNDPRDGNDIITLLGNYGNAVVDLGGGNDTFNGGIGGDNVSGGDGNDILLGGDGNDWLVGGNGDDILNGGAGNNTLTGGAGSDRFVLTTTGTNTIVDFTGGQDLIALSALSFGQLTIIQGTGTNQNNTLINNSNQLLAVLQGVQSNTITSADFVTAI